MAEGVKSKYLTKRYIGFSWQLWCSYLSNSCCRSIVLDPLF